LPWANPMEVRAALRRLHNQMTTSARNATHVATRGPEANIAAIADNPRLLARLRTALAESEFHCCSTATNAAELAGRTQGLDAVVLYRVTDRIGALEAVRGAKEVLPDTPLLAVWAVEHAADARKALRAGAAGLISETELQTTLVPTIRAVRSGLVCVPRPMRAPLETESLSMREKQVLGMVVTGCTNAEIATKLFLA
jgi:DNA-binding NarL/FixJ family response regulator